MQAFNFVFALWLQLEGLFNPRDVGGGAIVGINERWHPEVYEVLIKELNDGNVAKVLYLARDYLYNTFWLPAVRQGLSNKEVFLKFNFRGAWTTPAARKMTFDELEFMLLNQPDILARKLANDNISSGSVLHRLKLIAPTYAIFKNKFYNNNN